MKRAVEGMRVGGVKTVRVAPAAGFGDAASAIADSRSSRGGAS